MEFFLQHGQWGGPYMTEKVEGKETEKVPVNRNVTGYGSKLPTPYMVKHNGRWLRVYTVCYSNSGTNYVVTGGTKTVVSIYQ